MERDPYRAFPNSQRQVSAQRYPTRQIARSHWKGIDARGGALLLRRRDGLALGGGPVSFGALEEGVAQARDDFLPFVGQHVELVSQIAKFQVQPFVEAAL